MWFYLGESLDKKVLRVLRETRNQIQIVDVAQKIDLLSYCNEEGHHDHCHHEGSDLHIWLSPVLAKQQAETIGNALMELLPERGREAQRLKPSGIFN